MARAPYYGVTNGFPPDFYVITWTFFQTIHTGGRDQWYLQDVSSFAFLSDKSVE